MPVETDISPMEAIRRRLWSVASQIKGDDDSVQTEMGYRLRLWALDVAEECTPVYDVLHDDGMTKRVIAAFRAQQHSDAIPDEILLYRLSDEVTAAYRKMLLNEHFDEELPFISAARAALMALRAAVQDPDLADLRALGGMLGNVPEQAALALAYSCLDQGMDLTGTPEEAKKYFLTRETDERVETLIEGIRKDFAQRWLDMLDRRLDLGQPSAPTGKT